jgi:hypothetical protein
VEGDQGNKNWSRNLLHHSEDHKELGLEAASKKLTLTEHLAKVVQPHPPENRPEEDEALIQLLESPCQPEPPVNCLKTAQVQ